MKESGKRQVQEGLSDLPSALLPWRGSEEPRVGGVLPVPGEKEQARPPRWRDSEKESQPAGLSFPPVSYP